MFLAEGCRPWVRELGDASDLKTGAQAINRMAECEELAGGRMGDG